MQHFGGGGGRRAHGQALCLACLWEPPGRLAASLQLLLQRGELGGLVCLLLRGQRLFRRRSADYLRQRIGNGLLWACRLQPLLVGRVATPGQHIQQRSGDAPEQRRVVPKMRELRPFGPPAATNGFRRGP